MSVDTKRHKVGQRKKCPPGMKYVRGRCVKINPKTKTGIKILPDTPTRGIVLSEDKCASILKTRSVFLNWASLRKTSPLFGLDVRKPLYLVSQKKNGETHVVGVVTAKNTDGDSKTRILLKRAFAPPRRVVLKQKPVDLMIQKRHMAFRMEPKAELQNGGPLPPSTKLVDPDAYRMQSFIPKDAVAPGKLTLEKLDKVLSDSVGQPVSEGGNHRHQLIRSEARTMNDGQHFHILDHPEFGRLVSDIDGQHFHSLDGDKTGADASPHSHVFGLPNGEIIRTSVDGIHDHDVLNHSTANDGVHAHKIKVNGETAQTLSASEEAMELGPGMGDPMDEEQVDRGREEDPMVARAMAKHMDEIDTDFEKAWREAEEWTFKTLVEKQTTVQSVVLAKSRFSTMEMAREWVREHGFKTDKVDETPNTFRFRQFNPGRCKDGTFRNKRITRGVLAVICVPKGQETPSGLRREAGNHMAKQMEKKIIEQSTIRVDNRPTGFSFQRKAGILYAFSEPVKGQGNGSKAVVIVRQRLGSDGMEKAPSGAVDAMEVVDAPADKSPKDLAKENLGNLVLVLEKVKGSDRLREVDAFLAVMDPTKQAADKPCGCPD